MKRFNKAFTLTELLIALGVIGILCAILLPVIFNILPNQNTLMAKRAYYMVQTVIADMINDEACYPDKTNSTGENKRLGFDDGFGYANCLLWGGMEKTETIETSGSASEKFGKLFTDKVETTGTATVSAGSAEFETKGMLWKIIDSGFDTPNNKNQVAYIVVDVNGKEKPNCGQSALSTNISSRTQCSADQKSPDVFTMSVRVDGKVTILDNWAIDAVSISKDITEE